MGRLRAERAGPPTQGQVYAALRRTRLVEEGLGWQALGYSRCGRTDKGVSALSQVPPPPGQCPWNPWW